MTDRIKKKTNIGVYNNSLAQDFSKAPGAKSFSIFYKTYKFSENNILDVERIKETYFWVNIKLWIFCKFCDSTFENLCKFGDVK